MREWYETGHRAALPNGEIGTLVKLSDACLRSRCVHCCACVQVHGSGGNYTDGWRRTYVLAFRHQDTISLERKAGFTHSHNDAVNWDVFQSSQHSTTLLHSAVLLLNAQRLH